MMSILLSLLSILCMLLLVVGIHEAAHALAAYFFGVKIKKISLGFGKPLLRFQSKTGCEWVFALWPLGGYVQMLNTRIAPVEEKDWPNCFDKKPIFVRVLILLAGSAANILFAWLVLIFVFSVGINQSLPSIDSVVANSRAEKAGMQAGDTILEVAQKPVHSFREVAMQLLVSIDKLPVSMRVSNQEGVQRVLQLEVKIQESKTRSASFLNDLGIIPLKNAPKVRFQAANLLEALQWTNRFIIDTMYFMLKILQLIVTKVLPFSLLLGPLGLFSLTIVSFFQGLIVFLFFTASFSIAVGLANLFPIPGLDGGSIMYALLEKIRGKPISIAMEVLLHQLALIGAGVLLVQLILNDIR